MAYVTNQLSALSMKTKIILCALVVLNIGAASWVAYRWYSAYQGKQSQIILTDCLDEYQKALEEKDAFWSEVALMNNLGYEQVQQAALQPYFLMMEAQALAHQGKVAEAVALCDRSIAGISNNLPFKDYYTLTKALILLDAEDVAVQHEGVTLLKQLADANNSFSQDAALYCLAAYHLHNKNTEEAHALWKKLLDEADRFKDSPWVAKIKEKADLF